MISIENALIRYQWIFFDFLLFGSGAVISCFLQLVCVLTGSDKQMERWTLSSCIFVLSYVLAE